MEKLKVADILSLTDFHRNSKLHLKRLRLTGRAAILTVNGKAELVVQDAAAYEGLLDRLNRATHGPRIEVTDRVTRKAGMSWPHRPDETGKS
jgi:hypothetical protein